jgi:hypothetical protein
LAAAVGALGALLFAACGGDTEDAAADAGFALAEVPEGYVQCAVTVPGGLEIRNEDDAHLHVYADASLADPYDGPLIGVASFRALDLDALPLGDFTEVQVGAAPGRIGPISGFQLAQLPDDAGRVITWQEGERVIQVGGRGDVDDDTLLAAANGVRLDGRNAVIDLDALPGGFEDLGDVYTVESPEGFRFSVDYQRPEGDGVSIADQVTLLGSFGDEVAMEAFRFRAASSQRIDVNGRPGISADVSPDGKGPFLVTWLAQDNLVLRLFSFALEPEALVDVARSAELVTDDVWATLIDAPVDDGCLR